MDYSGKSDKEWYNKGNRLTEKAIDLPKVSRSLLHTRYTEADIIQQGIDELPDFD